MLIIVESPTKAKKIQAILKTRAMSTVGHFKDLPDALQQSVPGKFKEVGNESKSFGYSRERTRGRVERRASRGERDAE